MKRAKNYDVIIVGSGFAGLSAAISAAGEGHTVCVVEKLPKPGGNSRISDGGMGVAGSDLQAKAGIEYSPEMLSEDMIRAGLHKNDRALVECVAARSNDAYEWTKSLGVRWVERLDVFGGHRVARCLTPLNHSGGDIIDPLYREAKRLGVDFLFRHSLESIVMEDRMAKEIVLVPGFKAGTRKPKARVRLEMSKRLIIATGGYGADIRMVNGFTDYPDNLDTTNLKTATGEMIRLLIEIGCGVRDLEEVQLAPWTSPDEEGFGLAPLFGDYIVLNKGILVNPKNAGRFVNELADRKTLSEAMLKTGHVDIGIADEAIVKALGWDLSKALKKRIVRRFDTIDDLALHYGMRTTHLKNTISEYNETLKAGKADPFGKPAEGMHPIETPPFYGMRMSVKTHHTMGGVMIDTEAKVLDQQGEPFDNLFACGEVTGGVHGASRLGSMAVTECIVMGRIAGTIG